MDRNRQDDRPAALVLRTAGTNCDAEMCRAFELAGGRAEIVHVDRILADPARIEAYELIAFPGGFSYGDDIASGRILAVKLRERLWPKFQQAAARGVPMIGACNGFQVMVQLGLLPGPADGNWAAAASPRQTVALAHNSGGRFIDRWVGVAADPDSACIWTRPLVDAAAEAPGDLTDIMMLPIAHGEGRFVVRTREELAGLESRGQVALRYTDNPNGSQGEIAGICDVTGRIFGLMPHPERYLDWTLHPYWTRLRPGLRQTSIPPGLRMFQAAVEAARSVPAGA